MLGFSSLNKFRTNLVCTRTAVLIVKRDARLDLVLVLAGPILLQAFAGDE